MSHIVLVKQCNTAATGGTCTGTVLCACAGSEGLPSAAAGSLQQPSQPQSLAYPRHRQRPAIEPSSSTDGTAASPFWLPWLTCHRPRQQPASQPTPATWSKERTHVFSVVNLVKAVKVRLRGSLSKPGAAQSTTHCRCLAVPAVSAQKRSAAGVRATHSAGTHAQHSTAERSAAKHIRAYSAAPTFRRFFLAACKQRGGTHMLQQLAALAQPGAACISLGAWKGTPATPRLPMAHARQAGVETHCWGAHHLHYRTW